MFKKENITGGPLSACHITYNINNMGNKVLYILLFSGGSLKETSGAKQTQNYRIKIYMDIYCLNYGRPVDYLLKLKTHGCTLILKIK